MRITAFLLRRDRLPNGHIFRGKDRMVKRVTPVALRRLKEDFAIEEQNMLYLRHPFLTEEQSFGHAKAFGKHDNRMESLKLIQAKKFKEDVTLFERLLHLRTSEGWDK